MNEHQQASNQLLAEARAKGHHLQRFTAGIAP
jgi:hypothetical protein